jgi:hypothetical protein
MKREELLIEEEELVAIIDDPNLRFFDPTVALDLASAESGHAPLGFSY